MPAYRWPRRVCPGMREFLGRPCLRKVTRLLLLMEALEAGRAQNQEGLAVPGNRFVLPQTHWPVSRLRLVLAAARSNPQNQPARTPLPSLALCSGACESANSRSQPRPGLVPIN